MQPIPFEIFPDAEGVPKVATNGTVRIAVLDAGGQVKRRRAIKGLSLRPAAEVVLPHLNKLAGDIVSDLQMAPEELHARLSVLLGMIPTKPPQNVEWAVATLGDVNVYTDGKDILVTRADLQP